MDSISTSATNNIIDMDKSSKMITCITGMSVRSIVEQARELEISREDIVSMFSLRDQIYLVYYK